MSLPTAFGEIRCETSPARPPQCVHDGLRSRHTLTSLVLPPQRLTEDSATAVPIDGPRHGDVRIVVPTEHYFCSHHAYPDLSSLGAERGFRRGRQGPPHVLQALFRGNVGTVLKLQLLATACSIQTEDGLQAHGLSSNLVSFGGERQFFHAVTFEAHRLTEDSATAVLSNSLRHCILQSAFRVHFECCVLRCCVGVCVWQHAYHLVQILRAQDIPKSYLVKSLFLARLCWCWRAQDTRSQPRNNRLCKGQC